MEVPFESLNASPNGINVSLVGLCIIVHDELRFLKLIRLSAKEPSVFSGRIFSNKKCLRGVTHVKL